MVKKTRRYIILSNTWKTKFWICLIACVYIWYHFCSVFWSSISKRRIYNFLLCYICVIPGWKCSIVSRIVWKWSSIYKWIEISLYWMFLPDGFGFATMWSSGLPLPQTQISDLSDLEEDVKCHHDLLEVEKNYFVLWQRMSKMRKSNICPSSTKSTVYH